MKPILVKHSLVDLTPREVEVYNLIAVQGRSRNDAARALTISRETVKTHWKHICAKLDIHRVQQYTFQEEPDHDSVEILAARSAGL